MLTSHSGAAGWLRVLGFETKGGLHKPYLSRHLTK